LEAFSLASPSKPLHKDMDALPVIDDRKRSISPDSEKAEGPEVEEEGDLEELRKKFVGEIDLPESQWLISQRELRP
jgi:ribonucleoside-diphosphate reductase subunit M2